MTKSKESKIGRTELHLVSTILHIKHESLRIITKLQVSQINFSKTNSLHLINSGLNYKTDLYSEVS